LKHVNLNLFPEELLPAASSHCPLELLDLLDWAIELGLLRKDADVGHLHQWCMAEGLGTAAWRMLVKHGELTYQPVLDEYPSRNGLFMQCLNFVEWQARAGLERPLPPALGQQLVVVGRHSGLVPPVDPRVIRAVARHWLMVCYAKRQVQFASEDWAEVLLWMRDEKPSLDANKWRSGWPTIWREYQQWKLIQGAYGHWEPLLDAFTVDAHTITPLANAADLVREGLQMRHCAADYVDACRAGHYLMFSVAQHKTGKRVATVGIKKAGKHWKLDQLSGKANIDPGPSMQRIAKLIRKRVDEQEVLKNLELASRRLIRKAERANRIDLRVGWEGGDAPLMALDGQFWQPMEAKELPIAEELRERLRQWSARFRAFPPCHVIDQQDWIEMDEQLRGIAAELRCVLGPVYRVLGYEETAKKRSLPDGIPRY